MPTYEYKCKEHGHIFEVEQKMSDPPLTTCQLCEAEVERLIGMPTIFSKNSATLSFGINLCRRQVRDCRFQEIYS
jgi:putative FmdB family regulatory protein